MGPTYSYSGHVPTKLTRQKRYIYSHGKDKTIDVFDPMDMALVRNLNTDNEKFILALELEDKYLLASCSSGHSFLFSFPDFTRLKTKKLKDTPMSYY
jgi:hypothetical protein